MESNHSLYRVEVLFYRYTNGPLGLVQPFMKVGIYPMSFIIRLWVCSIVDLNTHSGYPSQYSRNSGGRKTLPSPGSHIDSDHILICKFTDILPSWTRFVKSHSRVGTKMPFSIQRKVNWPSSPFGSFGGNCPGWHSNITGKLRYNSQFLTKSSLLTDRRLALT